MAVYLKSLPQRDARAAADQQASACVSPAVMEIGPQGLREAVRDVPRRRRQGLPAGLSAARGQPVDHDGDAGQPDPHGAERRLPAGHAQEPAAARHAAVPAHPERRRSGGRRHLHPRRLGQHRHAGHAGAGRTSCASSCRNRSEDRERHRTDDRHATEASDAASRRNRRAAARRAPLRSRASRPRSSWRSTSRSTSSSTCRAARSSERDRDARLGSGRRRGRAALGHHRRRSSSWCSSR